MKYLLWLIAILILAVGLQLAAPAASAVSAGSTTLTAGQSLVIRANGCTLHLTKNTPAVVKAKCVASNNANVARARVDTKVVLDAGQSHKVEANQCRLNVTKNTLTIVKVVCVAVFSTTKITLPGTQLTALAAYETGNKLFAADDNSESVLVLEGTTYQKLATIPNVGGAVFAMVINETYGKVYAASDLACCTSGITPGTGKVAVIDASTNQLIKEIDPGEHYSFSFFLLGHDEVHDKVYVTWQGGVGVIDVATDQFIPIVGADYPYPYLDKMAINTVTNQIFLPHFGTDRLYIIDGGTLAVSFFDLATTRGYEPLDIVANEKENKVYLTMVDVPGQGEMGILALDMDTRKYRFVGKEDLEPLVFNQKSNQLFAGVQVGSRGAIVDGENNALTYVPMGNGGVGAGNLRTATNHAYFATTDETYIVDGALKKVVKKIPSGFNSGGGIFVWSVAINQKTGKVYVVNNDHKGVIQVIQD